MNRSVFIVCALLLAQAATAEALWTAESELRASDADSYSWLLSVDRSLGERGLIYVTVRESQVDAEGADLDTGSRVLGGMYRLNETWRLSAHAERWGRRGDIRADRLSSTLSGNGEQFGLSLIAGMRWITLSAGAPARSPGNGDNGPPFGIPVDPGDDDEENGDRVAEDFDLKARQLGIRGRWFLDDQWTLVAGLNWDSYDRNPGDLAAREAIEQLSSSAVTLAQSFRDRGLFFEVRHDFGEFRELSVYLARDRSAVDGRRADTLALSWIQPMADAWDVRLEVGRTRTEDFDPTHFVGVGLTWYP
ncbi:hypothetical protein VCB98_08470 [Gammaproteobacteria bacterium AB-CW1]|uniref:DUF481 domain-containing protein n=1 Tax=Natronospira elongata TaxID=3110268 RepID=A0AAP6JF72_9GAMM|nr:hypothetical protein [Gammaproteobacteria bacterium AB-CW1]